jgi:hypothetical protein
LSSSSKYLVVFAQGSICLDFLPFVERVLYD